MTARQQRGIGSVSSCRLPSRLFAVDDIETPVGQTVIHGVGDPRTEGIRDGKGKMDGEPFADLDFTAI